MEQIREGMVVYTADGEKLGKVVATRRSDAFVVEKGFLLPRDFEVRREQVAEVRDGEVHLSVTRDQIEAQLDGAPSGETPRRESGDQSRSRQTMGSGAVQETRVPLAEEEVEVQKRVREKGAVRVTKQVRTEEKLVSVPVTREEVRVERVPVQPGRPADEAAFRGDTVTVPVTEEQVEIRKRPVVKEELRVSKRARTDEQRVGTTVRKEEVDVDADVEEDDRGTPLRGESGTPDQR